MKNEQGLYLTGAVLRTRDGRKIGNAIVISHVEGNYHKVKTDYGNEAIFTINEIDELFHCPTRRKELVL